MEFDKKKLNKYPNVESNGPNQVHNFQKKHYPPKMNVPDDEWSRGFKNIPSDILNEDQWAKSELDDESLKYIVDIAKCTLTPQQLIDKLKNNVIITSKKIKIDQLVNDDGFDYSKDFS